MKRRIKGIIEYDGSAFEGFQRQTRTPHTVQGVLERALASLGIESPVTGSGRTDAGVHASGQVIHFDLPGHWSDQPLDKLRTHLNNRLDAIRFKHLTPVPRSFHARYDARVRIYRYVLSSRVGVFERRYVTRWDAPPPLDRINHALARFVGRHDFAGFMKSGSDVRSTVRTVYRAYALPRRGKLYIYVHGDAFLRSQVRLMVQAALLAAAGEIPMEAITEQLEGRALHVRRPAPPQGLYLARVLYTPVSDL
ncbi:tRNA pseudouridine(38-40) synthase TruA [Nitratifractor sp.]